METKNLNTKYCVGLGEILFDVLPSGSQLGGAPANFAYHAGQHGLHSVAVSAVGKDALGDTALRILDEKKLKYVMPEVDYPTGTVQVQLDKEGVPTYDIKQGVAWDNIPFTSDIREIAVNLFSSEDTYLSHFHTFEMDGFTVRIENNLLAEALENLDGKKRDVILRYYFLGFDDTEISKILEVNRSTIQRRRHAGLEFIKKFMEEEA